MARGKKPSSALMDFLIRTATDPDALARFLDDPEATVRAAKLAATDRRRVLSRDAKTISAAFRSLRRHLDPILVTWIVRPLPDLGGGRRPGRRRPSAARSRRR